MALRALLFLLFLSLTQMATAQKRVSGTVRAPDGETLPSANISLENTYRGTISNREGRYTLTIPDSLLPATMVVRYLGFRTETRVIRSGSSRNQDFTLSPSTLQLGEVVVTGEDPAIGIMREVIRRKQQWREQLETYRAEAYTRQTLSNDTSIVMISESVSEAFWDSERGHREVLKSKRQTANIEAANNFAGVSYLPNFYDDNIEIAGFELMGVTHPDALRFYRFRLEEYSNLDDQTVYEISVTPARRLQPLFEGTIYVLDEAYALLEVRLEPNEVVTFPPPVKSFSTSYEQQFNNFGRAFWLPVDMRISGDIKISMVGLEFPEIRFRQVSQITNYEVNITLPDTLYREDDIFSVDSATVESDSLFVSAIKSVPLSREEEQAYSTLDSTATLEKAFKPSGFLARFIEDDDDREGSSGISLFDRLPGDLAPAPRYNRVDALYAGLSYRVRPADRLRLSLNGGYSTGYRQWSYGGALRYRLIDRRAFRQEIGIGYRAGTDTQGSSTIYSPAFTGMATLFGEPDYFNYYRNEGWHLLTGVEIPRSDWSANVTYRSERHDPLLRQTAYDLLGRDQPLQPNPAAERGDLRSIGLTFGYNADEGHTFGATGFRQALVTVERAAGALGSDFDYTRYHTGVSWSIPTFYPRRFLPNTLDFTLSGGTYSGQLPLQKLGMVDGAVNHFSPFGVLKTRRQIPYLGSNYWSAHLEHNFRSIPFEAIGFRKAVEWNWGIILFAGAGDARVSDRQRRQVAARTGYLIPESDGPHLEAGISLNGVFGLLRLDLARRIDRDATVFSVSIARIF